MFFAKIINIVERQTCVSIAEQVTLEVRVPRKSGGLCHVSDVKFIAECVGSSSKAQLPRKSGGLWHISSVEFIAEFVVSSSRAQLLEDIPKGNLWHSDYLSFDKKSDLKKDL